MFLKRLPYLFLLSLWLPGLGIAQGHAGPDRTICLSGTTKLGPETPCTSCCYKWSPETGLDDPSKPNPLVSGLENSVIYAVTVSFPDGNYEEDDVKVTVYEPDIDIYEPEYYAPETMILEEEKRIPGAQTFVNIDNDDCDAEFDENDDLVQGGDNEFVKIRISMRIPPVAAKPGKGKGEEKEISLLLEDKYAAVDLAGGTMISGVNLWMSNDKSAGEYQIGDKLLLTDLGEDNYEAFLWAEGTEAHIIQQQVKLTARLFDDVNPACADNYVSLTVLGVDKMEWIGVENGFTGDGKNNSNVLDRDINGLDPTAFRVFPENKSIAKTAVPKTKVNLKITFTTEPVAPHPVYLKTFDLDDAITELNFVDPNDGGTDGLDGNYVGIPSGIPQINYTKDDDNRGKAFEISSTGVVSVTGYKQGILRGTNTAPLTGFPGVYKRNAVNTKETTMDFWVSQSCGDNYKVAVSNDVEFIKTTRNRDRFDGQKIVNSCLSPSSPDSCKEINPKLCSPALTVWRTLHIEYDLMKNPNWDDNFIFTGTFDDFESSALTISSAIRINGLRPDSATVGRYKYPDQPLKDLSPFPGRFERGGVRISTNRIAVVEPTAISAPVSSTPKPYLISNNDDQVVFSQPVDLSLGGTLVGVLRKTGMSDFQFKIKEISKTFLSPPEFEIELTVADSNVFMYENSNVSIAGGPFSADNKIHIINSSTFEIRATNAGKSNLKIPVEVRDDDSIALNSTSTLIKRISFVAIDSIFKKVYINVVDDGGGNTTNNNNALLFTKNLASPIVTSSTDFFAGPTDYDYYNVNDTIFSSRKFANDNYWICQLLGGWQQRTDFDGDPDRGDPGIRGIARTFRNDEFIDKGGNFVVIFHEALRESEGRNCATIELTGAHEIGHCFGLSHGDEATPGTVNSKLLVSTLSDMGIMVDGSIRKCSTSNDFIQYHQNIIRLRVKSPGK